MSVISLEQAAAGDLDLLAALKGAHLPTDDIEDDGRTFFKALSDACHEDARCDQQRQAGDGAIAQRQDDRDDRGYAEDGDTDAARPLEAPGEGRHGFVEPYAQRQENEEHGGVLQAFEEAPFVAVKAPR